jgi:uncharacterized membrane protein
MGPSHGGGKDSRDKASQDPASQEKPRVVARARLLLFVLVVPLLLATVLGLVVLWPAEANPPTPDLMGRPSQLVDATVVRVDRRPCGGATDAPGAGVVPTRLCQAAEVTLTGSGGPDAGKVVDIEMGQGADSPVLHTGDKIVVGHPDTGKAGDGSGWYFSDFQRKGPLLALAILFAAGVVIFGRWRGVRALAGLAVTFAVLVRFILPAILVGKNPVAVAVVGSAAIMFAVYLAHGITARTTTAVLGTVGALFLTGALAWIFVTGTHATGMATEASGLLAASLTGVTLRGLLLGGIVIGSLGVLDDVTATQASVVWELHLANPEYDFHRLYRAGLRKGRDHVASTVNTLVMAYAGASLPLLVLFTLSSRRLGDVLTGEIVAQEIVRTLVGSIGLVSAVPLTTALAAFVADRSVHREPDPIPALFYAGEGSLSQPSASSASRPARRRRSSMPAPPPMPPAAPPKARPRTKVPRGPAGRATP